jgi:hypothetical protein
MQKNRASRRSLSPELYHGEPFAQASYGLIIGLTETKNQRLEEIDFSPGK